VVITVSTSVIGKYNPNNEHVYYSPNGSKKQTRKLGELIPRPKCVDTLKGNLFISCWLLAQLKLCILSFYHFLRKALIKCEIANEDEADKYKNSIL